jgi:acyl carrier protein
VNTLERVIYPAVDELAPSWRGVTLRKDPATPLIGQDAALDSFALVTLIVTVEARVSDELGRSITLASEQALSRTHSPFRTLGTLAAYVDELLAASGDA